jgi:hypothetical protein
VDGKRFVALRDVSAKCIVILSPLLSDMRDVVVRTGEVLRVVSAREDMVSCRPHRYLALEADFVDPETRAHPGYKGYGLVIDRAVMDRDCASVV